jgi:hypothetical protein
VKRELFGEPEQPAGRSYSFAAEPSTENPLIDYDSGTEFSAAIHGRDPVDIWPIMDEMMSTVQVLTPRLYDNVMRRL